MTIEELKLLTDIMVSITSIDEHLEGKRNYEEFISNKTKRRAVERELEIIGEAMNNLIKLNSNILLSYKRVAVDLRNKIIHAYDSINTAIIWKVIVTDFQNWKKKSKI